MISINKRPDPFTVYLAAHTCLYNIFISRYQDAAKPTHRPLDGHVVSSKNHSDKIVKNEDEWAKLSLT